jgi:hypothetical protein
VSVNYLIVLQKLFLFTTSKLQDRSLDVPIQNLICDSLTALVDDIKWWMLCETQRVLSVCEGMKRRVRTLHFGQQNMVMLTVFRGSL